MMFPTMVYISLLIPVSFSPPRRLQEVTPHGHDNVINISVEHLRKKCSCSFELLCYELNKIGDEEEQLQPSCAKSLGFFRT